jgi:uncharacterized membrane protein
VEVDEMALFLVGLVAFMALHLMRVIAPGMRAQTIARIGTTGYHLAHSAAALLTFALLVYGFGLARAETGILYDPPMFLRHLCLGLMLLASILVAAAFLPAGHIAHYAKHPLVLAIKVWAVAHLMANGETVQVILFASFLAFGVILRISYKRRQRAGELVPRVYKSWLYDLAAIAIGVAVYAAIYLRLHEVLIGVPVAVM